ncbi:hypothetical protein QE152_g12688 [Popillia japonica]|uniref:Uncharacterized protein n=1 Tax=Popillia japonica TaxID=7064 RepID=A0AAW1LQU7_POPJA
MVQSILLSFLYATAACGGISLDGCLESKYEYTNYDLLAKHGGSRLPNFLKALNIRFIVENTYGVIFNMPLKIFCD